MGNVFWLNQSQPGSLVTTDPYKASQANGASIYTARSGGMGEASSIGISVPTVFMTDHLRVESLGCEIYEDSAPPPELPGGWLGDNGYSNKTRRIAIRRKEKRSFLVVPYRETVVVDGASQNPVSTRIFRKRIWSNSTLFSVNYRSSNSGELPAMYKLIHLPAVNLSAGARTTDVADVFGTPPALTVNTVSIAAGLDLPSSAVTAVRIPEFWLVACTIDAVGGNPVPGWLQFKFASIISPGPEIYVTVGVDSGISARTTYFVVENHGCELLRLEQMAPCANTGPGLFVQVMGAGVKFSYDGFPAATILPSGVTF